MTRRGRPIGIARQVAEATGVNLRTVQRAIAKEREEPLTDQQRRLNTFLTSFRNFATFCRENPAQQVGDWTITDDQARRISEWSGVVRAWLNDVNDGDDT